MVTEYILYSITLKFENYNLTIWDGSSPKSLFLDKTDNCTSCVGGGLGRYWYLWDELATNKETSIVVVADSSLMQSIVRVKISNRKHNRAYQITQAFYHHPKTNWGHNKILNLNEKFIIWNNLAKYVMKYILFNSLIRNLLF